MRHKKGTRHLSFPSFIFPWRRSRRLLQNKATELLQDHTAGTRPVRNTLFVISARLVLRRDLFGLKTLLFWRLCCFTAATVTTDRTRERTRLQRDERETRRRLPPLPSLYISSLKVCQQAGEARERRRRGGGSDRREGREAERKGLPARRSSVFFCVAS